MSERRRVLPGEELGTTEEALPGPGTYEENGRIYAAVTGVLDVDPKELTTVVRPFNPPVNLRVGDAVICRVSELRSQMAEVELMKVAGKDRSISNQGVGSIHVSHMSDRYVNQVEDAFRLLDLVRGKVIQVDPSIQLSTVGPEFGVIRALCGRCRQPLTLKGELLSCEECQRTESRKIASSYGTTDFWKAPTPEEMAADQAHFAQEAGRRGGREGGRGGGRGGFRGGRGRDGGGRDRGDRDRRHGDRGGGRDRRFGRRDHPGGDRREGDRRDGDRREGPPQQG